MPSLKWTPQALADVQRLHRFLADKNPDAAKRAAHAIRAGVKILARQPRIGHPAENMDPEFREWLIPFGQSGYLVLYRIGAGAVVLLAVRHGREAGFGVVGRGPEGEPNRLDSPDDCGVGCIDPPGGRNAPRSHRSRRSTLP